MHKTVVILSITIMGAISCYAEYQPFKKCHALSGEDANVNLEEAVQTFKNCFMVNKENFRHQIATSTSCWSTTQKIEECEDSIAKTTSECGSSDEQHFPRGIFKMIGKYVNSICSRAPDYKLSVLLDRKICFPSLGNGIGCLEKFQFFNSTVKVTRDDMCQNEMEVKECFLDYVNNTCIDDSLFSQYITESFDLDKPPCGKDSAMSTCNIILFTFVMVTLTVIM